MFRILLCLLVTLLVQSRGKAEPLTARLTLHKDLSLKDLTPVY